MNVEFTLEEYLDLVDMLCWVECNEDTKHILPLFSALNKFADFRGYESKIPDGYCFVGMSWDLKKALEKEGRL